MRPAGGESKGSLWGKKSKGGGNALGMEEVHHGEKKKLGKHKNGWSNILMSAKKQESWPFGIAAGTTTGWRVLLRREIRS